MSLWNAVCSVLLCFSVRKRTHPRYEIRPMRLAAEFFLSQNSQILQNLFTHCFDSTEGLRHTEVTEAFQLRLAVRFCEIGWLNVSVGLCVFCSSVLFCEKKNIGELSWGVLSLTKDIFFSHRAHRVHWAFWRTVSSPQNAFGIQSSQSVTAKGGCKVLWNRLT